MVFSRNPRGYSVIRTDDSRPAFMLRLDSAVSKAIPPFLRGWTTGRKSMDAGIELPIAEDLLVFASTILAISSVEAKARKQLFGYERYSSGAPGNCDWGIGPRWLSENHVDYYYGVREDEATLSRPAYSGKTTYNLDITITPLSI